MLLGAALAAVAHPAAGGDLDARGLRLFRGELPLAGRLYTQSEDLPDAVTRCANCHAHGQSAPVANSTAPRLDAAFLIAPRSRRGGPRFAYDGASFCSVLRSGIDPTRVLISVEMPRFALADADCAALWRLVTTDADTP